VTATQPIPRFGPINTRQSSNPHERHDKHEFGQRIRILVLSFIRRSTAKCPSGNCCLLLCRISGHKARRPSFVCTASLGRREQPITLCPSTLVSWYLQHGHEPTRVCRSHQFIVRGSACVADACITEKYPFRKESLSLLHPSSIPEQRMRLPQVSLMHRLSSATSSASVRCSQGILPNPLVSMCLISAAALLFAIALLAAGQSASIIATVAGQAVSEGFLRWRVSVSGQHSWDGICLNSDLSSPSSDDLPPGF
jgi:hypothetical protein